MKNLFLKESLLSYDELDSHCRQVIEKKKNERNLYSFLTDKQKDQFWSLLKTFYTKLQTERGFL